jgi:muramoyltetrapeptide carboxypeptidase
LLALIAGRTTGGEITLEPVPKGAPSGKILGTLFGGCYSVLTNLIGTPYLPKSLRGHILFFEDLDEHPARLMRHWNQWLQSGLLEGVQAVVIGNLLKLGQNIPDNAEYVFEEWARRCPAPLFKSNAFGHLSPNFPLGIGAAAEISSERNWSLKWKFVKDQQSIS